MLFDSINNKKRKIRLISILSILAFYLSISTFSNSKNITAPSNFTHNEVEIKHASSSPYAPSISIIKSAPAFDGSDCSEIPFTYTITNQGGIGEELQNVVITDLDFGGIIAGPMSSDYTGDTGGVGGDGILSPGEIWTFEISYTIAQTDLDNGQFIGQIANVNAELVSNPSIEVGDTSHPSDPNGEAPTIVDLSACQNPSIGLIKEWAYFDLDNDACAENFLYTFRVRNTGDISLQNIVLNDPLLGGAVPGPKPGADIGGDGILSPGEEWEYQALYAADLEEGGAIFNQADVTAETVVQNIEVSDLSDDGGQNGGGGTFGSGSGNDDGTIAAYDDPSCGVTFVRIALIKEATPTDDSGDNCFESILYTFSVQNVGQAPLENILLTDDMLGGEIANRTNNGNGDEILDPGETWTYEANYNLVQADYDAGFVSNQALVQAEIEGLGIALFDYSDDTSYDENDQTIVPACLTSSMALVKSVGVSDYLDLDNNGCVETIRYNFEVSNTGGIALENVVLNDNVLGGPVNGPIPITDTNGDGVLSVGETWTYQALHSLTPQNVSDGEVTNQAQVTAYEENTNNQVSAMDEITTPLGANACPAVASIGLIKRAPLIGLQDLDNDGCPETVTYQFTVTNTGSIHLGQITLIDTPLKAPITGPQGDIGGDSVLSVGESWTYEALYPITDQDEIAGQVTNQAQVTAIALNDNSPISDLSDHTNNDEDRATTIVFNQTVCAAESRIGLLKRVPLGNLEDLDNDGCDETIRYFFDVENIGTITLENIELTDVLFGGTITDYESLQGDVNNDQVLSIGERWKYEVLYPLNDQDIADLEVVNQAQVTANEWGTNIEVADDSDPTDYAQDRPTITSTVGACPAEAGIELTKTGVLADSGNGCFDTIEYTFSVANTGALDLEEVMLNDTVLGGPLNGPIPISDSNGDGKLSVGETWIYQAQYALTLQDVSDGQVTNEAQVTALEEGSGNQVSAMDEITTLLGVNACAAEAGIGLKKTGVMVDSGNGCFDTIEYTFTVANTGTIELDNVVLTDADLGGEITGLVQSTDINTKGVLSVGEEWTYVAQYAITEADITANEVRNRAEVNAQEVISDNPVSDFSDHTDYTLDRETVISPLDNVCTPSGINLNKFVGGLDFIDQNNDGCTEAIRYNFIISNTGTVNLLNVILTDDNLGGQVIELPIGDSNNDQVLSVGEQWTYQVLYHLTPSDIGVLSVMNQADVAAVEEGTNNPVLDTDEITIPLDDTFCPSEAVIELEKSGELVNLDGDNCMESIQYTFTVSNTGTMDLAQIVLTDTDLNVPIIGPTGDTGNDQMLSIGEVWTYEATYPITQADIDGGTVLNQASVSAVEQENNTSVSDSSDSVIIDVSGACVAESKIGLIKTAGSQLEDVDNDGCPENISYTFTVKNTGAIILQDVVLNDIKLGPGSIEGPLPGNDINGDTYLSVGETWTYQALYPISEQDSIAGQVINRAQVSAVELGTTIMVTDDSDNNSFDEDDDTITSIAGACVARAGIKLVKNGVLVDQDGDGCAESIQYTFAVENTGAINLYQILLEDTLLQQADIQGPLPGSDINGDQVLSVGETWMFEAFYSITQQDIADEEVTNQATVSALEVFTNNTISDESEEIVTIIEGIPCVDPVDPDFKIFNGISPNGDGVNDYFQIKGIESYPNNTLKVFNRWGVLVFEMDGYGLGNQQFTGHSDSKVTVAKDRKLPSGTYFYTLTFHGNDNPGEKSYSGYLYINQD
ncbi:gliding motility-associated C-terminal domain-containing protein [Muricauda sp. MAR_2010_75]|uniref:gliding motility-associated C-terminal domain-containing protein n=1 Tax=Allomuricauda sp. MAR_2010_75 TaxID=1250232 RepID=UPI00055F17F9|nr:T9SS C-terminal target domain-containing protein [Muricauda sp. MAR_2010_75]